MRITRSPGGASLLPALKSRQASSRKKLEAAGAEVIAIPAIEIAPPDSYVALDTALQQILSYDWLVLTSANAVGAIVERARHLSIPITNLSAVFIAAIGNATADALTRLGLAVELTPPQAVAESLAAALSPRVKGKLVLLIRAKVARDVSSRSARNSRSRCDDS